MLSTPALHHVVTLADRNRWRLALIGDPRQLQGVGRGGLLAELCANGRVEQLERLHRFTHRWEATASLQLRSGDPTALDAYEAHGRIVAGSLDDHLDRLAATWIDHHDTGRSIAVVASTNDHVDTINQAIQTARFAAGHLDPTLATRLAVGETAYVGDVIATRRNDRRLVTSIGEPVRNRDTWTVTAIMQDGSIAVSHQGEHGDVTLPVDYVRDHVRLGYAATEHGWQSDTVDTAIALTSPVTTRRGLYVAATRGSERQRHLRDHRQRRHRRGSRRARDDPRHRPCRRPRHHPAPHPRPVHGMGDASSTAADAALRDPRLVPNRSGRRPTRPHRRTDP